MVQLENETQRENVIQKSTMTSLYTENCEINDGDNRRIYVNQDLSKNNKDFNKKVTEPEKVRINTNGVKIVSK